MIYAWIPSFVDFAVGLGDIISLSLVHFSYVDSQVIENSYLITTEEKQNMNDRIKYVYYFEIIVKSLEKKCERYLDETV